MCFIPFSVIDHVHNMHDHLNRACHRKKKEVGITEPQILARRNLFQRRAKKLLDLTLYHDPSGEFNKMLKIKITNLWRTRRQSWPLSMRRCAKVLVNSCMWATVHLSNNDDQFHRVIQNVDMESIQKIFSKVQSQIQTLKRMNFTV